MQARAWSRSAFADTIHDLSVTLPGRPRPRARFAPTVKVPRRERSTKYASLAAVLACGVVAFAAACAAFATSPLGQALLDQSGAR